MKLNALEIEICEAVTALKSAKDAQFGHILRVACLPFVMFAPAHIYNQMSICETAPFQRL